MIDSIVDVSHHNGPSLDVAKAKQAGIVGVIHQATLTHVQDAAGRWPTLY